MKGAGGAEYSQVPIFNPISRLSLVSKIKLIIAQKKHPACLSPRFISWGRKIKRSILKNCYNLAAITKTSLEMI